MKTKSSLKKPNISLTPSTVLLIFILGILISSSFFIYFKLQKDEFLNYTQNNNIVYFLLNIKDSKRLYSSQVFIYNTKNRKSSVISVYPNYSIKIPSLNRVRKIEYILLKEGINSYIKTLNKEFGLDIKYYMSLDLKQLSTVTDLIGGIDMDIALNQKINGKEYKISPEHYVDGDKIITLIMYTYFRDNYDEKYVNYFKFATSFLQSLSFFFENNHINNIIKNIFFKNIKTNLDENSFMSLLSSLYAIDYKNSINQKIEGSARDTESQDGILNLFYPQIQNAVSNQTKQLLSVLNSDLKPQNQEKKIEIEILNGTNINGLARKMQDVYIQNGNFDIVKVGNSTVNDTKSTIIINRKGNKEDARLVAKVIGGDENQIEENVNLDYFADFTIIIGEDFENGKIKQ